MSALLRLCFFIISVLVEGSFCVMLCCLTCFKRFFLLMLTTSGSLLFYFTFSVWGQVFIYEEIVWTASIVALIFYCSVDVSMECGDYIFLVYYLVCN